MNPLRLRAVNYRSFLELDLRLPEGVVAIVGENGAGKSSIANVIDLALFGPESRSLADYLTDDVVEEDLLLELEFEHAGETYRVRRGYSPRGRGKTTLDFERRIMQDLGTHLDSYWEPLTRESQKETQSLIEQTVGLSRETFRASAFLAQGDGAAFTEAQPRDRKRVLAEVLGLDVWERLLECARSDRRETQTRLSELSGAIERAQAELAQREQTDRLLAAAIAAEEKAAEEVAGAEEHLEVVSERQRQQAAAVEKHRAATLALQAAKAELERLEEIERSGQDARAALEVARDELATLATREAAAAAEAAYAADLDRWSRVGRLIEEADGLAEIRAVQLREKADELEQAPALGECELCGQLLEDPDARRRVIESYRSEAAEAETRAAALNAEAAELGLQPPDEASVLRVRDGLSRRERLEERCAMLRPLAAALDEPGREEAIAQARAAVAELQATLDATPGPFAVNDLGAMVDVAKRHLQAAKEALARAVEARIRLSAERERLEKVAGYLADDERERQEAQAEHDLLQLLERAYGRDGIPALIVESAAIPQIEAEASRILTELGTGFRVELRTQRELKSQDGLADTLDVVVVSETGAVRPYETFSGGERSRLNVALRIALARLLAHRRGAESRLLCIDEIEYLDEPGQTALVSVLQSLRDDFGKIIVVSHAPALRDAFDHTIEVAKVDGRSQVTDGVRAEAIA